MKKLFAILVCFALAVSAMGCGKATNQNRKAVPDDLTGESVIYGKIIDILNDTLYIETTSGQFFVDNWMEYIPTGPSFELGDEVTVTYSGIATETQPAGLCGVTKIDLVNECAETECPALIMVNGVLYYDSTEISTEARCGMMDGTLDSKCDGNIPKENNQSNFGTGYGYQVGLNCVEVLIDSEWHVFKPFIASEWGFLPVD